VIESEFWLELEFRLSRECARFPERGLRFLWCDGLQADAETVLEGGISWVCGTALISEDDGKSFVNYRFRLMLGPGPIERDDIDWGSLLPGDESSGWL